jgi:hypothetical protein
MDLVMYLRDWCCPIRRKKVVAKDMYTPKRKLRQKKVETNTESSSEHDGN